MKCDLDHLKPNRKEPEPLSYEKAKVMKRPRRGNVEWDHRGGCLCCELCTNQRFGPRTVMCLSSDDPPLFRPFPPNDEF